MKSFKQHYTEANVSVEPKSMTLVQPTDLPGLLGKGAFNSLIKHPWMKDWSAYEHAWKHGVDSAGFHTVELYPYMRSVHTTPDGKIRPTTMVQFKVSHFGPSGKVVQAHKYTRASDPTSEWKHVKGWKQT